MSKGNFHWMLFLYLLIFTGGTAIAQDLPLQTWFEKNQTRNIYDISVHYLSADEEINLMTYEILVEEDGQVLPATITKGEFLSVPQLPTLLASVHFSLQAGSQGVIKLKLQLENKVIWQDQFRIEAPKQMTAIANSKPQKVEIQPQIEQPKLSDSKILEKVKPQPIQKTKVDKVSSPYFEDAEIGGLIIDESRTKLGRDFYEQFFSKWIAPNGVGDSFIIKIKELPSFGRVSRISVLVNEQTLMTRSLSPNFGQLEANVNASIRGVRRYLSQRLQMGKDIENEDQIGTGIY